MLILQWGNWLSNFFTPTAVIKERWVKCCIIGIKLQGSRFPWANWFYSTHIHVYITYCFLMAKYSYVVIPCAIVMCCLWISPAECLDTVHCSVCYPTPGNKHHVTIKLRVWLCSRLFSCRMLSTCNFCAIKLWRLYFIITFLVVYCTTYDE